MKKKRIVRDCAVFIIGTVWFLIKIVISPVMFSVLGLIFLSEWLEEEPNYRRILYWYDDIILILPLGHKLVDYLDNNL